MTVAESGRYPRSIVEKIGVLAGQMRAGRVCRCAVAVLVVVVGLLWIELGVAEATVGQPAQDEFIPLESVPPRISFQLRRCSWRHMRCCGSRWWAICGRSGDA